MNFFACSPCIRSAEGNLLSSERPRIAVHHAREKGFGERHVCRSAGEPRGTRVIDARGAATKDRPREMLTCAG